MDEQNRPSVYNGLPSGITKGIHRDRLHVSDSPRLWGAWRVSYVMTTDVHGFGADETLK